MPDDNNSADSQLLGGTDADAGNTGEPAANQEFLNSLPEELRAEPSLMRIADNGVLAKSFLEGQRVIGSSIKLPGEGATPEDVRAFQQKLGMPESADAYELNHIEGPDEAKISDTESAWFRGVAHKLGLSKSNTEELYREWSQFSADEYKTGMEEHNRMHNETVASLKADLGEQYEAKTKVADEWYMNNFSEETRKLLSDMQLGDNPNFIKDIIALTGKTSGDTIGGTIGNPGSSGVDLNSQLRGVTGDPEYWSNSAKGKELQAQALVLAQQISAGAK